MSEEELNDDARRAFGVFRYAYLTAEPSTPGMRMMNLNEISEWILGNTAVDISDLDLIMLLKEFGFQNTSTESALMWLVCPVE